MKFKVHTDQDYKLVLIRRSSVEEIFDQDDLFLKQNPDKPIEPKYHENWIHQCIFCVPSFYLRGEKAYVGSGRHRLILLSNHMDEIPAAFENKYLQPNGMNTALSKIVIRNLSNLEEIEYPDLPVDNLGDDVNGTCVEELLNGALICSSIYLTVSCRP